MGVAYPGLPDSVPPLKLCRLGGLLRGADPGGLVTNWNALPEDGLLRVGDERGAIEMNPGVGVAWLSVPPPPGTTVGVRLDQINLVAGDLCEPGDVVSGEMIEDGVSVGFNGISFGGAFTGDTIAFGLTSCGAPAGIGTL